MTYSIVKIAGKQFKIKAGDTIVVDRLDAKEGDTIALDAVLLDVADDKVSVGTPTVEGKSLSAKVVEHLRGDKIRVAKFKSKSRYRKVQGHRQDQTKLEILGADSKKSTKTSTKKSS